MVLDSRWPVLPLVILRGAQLLFSIILLGTSGNIIAELASTYSYSDSYYGTYTYSYSSWGANMTLSAALFTMIYSAINAALLFSNLLLPLAITIVDAFLLLLWLISVGGMGGLLSILGLFDSTCITVLCGVFKATFALSFVVFLTFIGTLILASITLYTNRKDLRGAKYNSGLTPSGEAIGMQYNGEPTAPTAPTVPGYYEEAKPVDGYYPQQAHSIVSPPQTPAPYAQQPPPPPPPPPVNVQEMPGYH